MFLDFPIFYKNRRAVTACEVSENTIENLLSIQKGANRQNELCEESHPDKKEENKNYSITNNIPGIVPEAFDLRGNVQIADDQYDHPAYNVKPLFPKGISIFHVSEF